MSNDHDLNHAIRKKNNAVTKEYKCLISREKDNTGRSVEERVKQLSNGVELHHEGFAKVYFIPFIDIKCLKPISVTLNEDEKWQGEEYNGNTKVCAVTIIISEGRKHIVRKLCKAAKLSLIHLHRTRIANVTVDGIKGGTYRYLTDDEVFRLWEIAGDKDEVLQQQLVAVLKLILLHKRDGIVNPKLI